MFRTLLALSAIASFSMLAGATTLSMQEKTRAFEFNYEARLEGLPPGKSYRLWMPVPQELPEQQQVTDVTEKLPGRITVEQRFGNRMLYVEGKADEKGQVICSTDYRIIRREVTSGRTLPSSIEREMFLQPDKLVPIEGKPLTLISGKQLPGDRMQLARALYDVVNSHMKYSKEGTGWGRGDSNWACDSKFGNCTDFHSLFISLSRAQKMPAKFEIGFSLPDARGAGDIAGYHCWAFFQPDKNRGWVPVDISEANKNPKLTEYYFGNLNENRLTMSTGRDLMLEPAQAGLPLNFFIYPYAEIDGKPLAAEKIKRVVKFKDVE